MWYNSIHHTAFISSLKKRSEFLVLAKLLFLFPIYISKLVYDSSLQGTYSQVGWKQSASNHAISRRAWKKLPWKASKGCLETSGKWAAGGWSVAQAHRFGVCKLSSWITQCPNGQFCETIVSACSGSLRIKPRTQPLVWRNVRDGARAGQAMRRGPKINWEK